MIPSKRYFSEEYLDIRGIRYRAGIFSDENASAAETIVFLHGFTGSGEAFRYICENLGGFRCVIIDLIGHGSTESPDNAKRYAIYEQIADLYQIFTKLSINRVHLLGYSMGGRLAMRFATKYPDLVRTLILESTHPGIESTKERNEREFRDNKLAEDILMDYPGFMSKWNRLPLLQSPEEGKSDENRKVTHEHFKHIQAGQNPVGIANSLREFGAGNVDSVKEPLKKLNIPAGIITGSADIAYTQMWNELTSDLHNGTHYVIRNAGHRVHLDCPDVYIQTIKTFINSIK